MTKQFTQYDAKPGWRPSSTAPMDGTPILALQKGRAVWPRSPMLIRYVADAWRDMGGTALPRATWIWQMPDPREYDHDAAARARLSRDKREG